MERRGQSRDDSGNGAYHGGASWHNQTVLRLTPRSSKRIVPLFPDPGARKFPSESHDVFDVKNGQSKDSIINEIPNDITLTQLRSQNPNIVGLCSNLDRLTDSVICISPPGGLLEFDTKNASISTSAGKVGGKIAAGECRRYHTVKAGESCASIFMRFEIILEQSARPE